MELKVVCNCGQKYKFDVEPVNGVMPFSVNCPACGVDGTQSANSILAQNLSSPSATTTVAPVPGLRINSAVPPAVSAPPPLAPAPRAAAPTRPQTPALQNVKSVGEFNLGLGILGAILGAGLGAGLMYAFFIWANFRFPLMGTGIGALAGLGARLLYKGTDMTLGIIAGCVALLATAGSLYLMYGDVAGLFIISMVVSVSLAYKIAG
jgi:hypothetical protein